MPENSRLIDLLVEWEDRLREGQEVSAEELAANTPDLLPDLKRRIADLRKAQGLLEVGSTVRGGTTIHPSPPPSVPGYEILGELGRGGMGVVYKARQVGLNRLVALKMILAGAHADADELARFRIEAEAAARLQHPHIVQVHEIGEWRSSESSPPMPFFSLEYVEGGSLAQRLNGTPLPPTEGAQLVETLAQAVQAAHQRGVVHRDLKPANILLVSGGVVSGEWSNNDERTTHHSPLTTHQPKITDFGLAKRLDVATDQTKTGSVMGTPSYMAPEQALGRTQEIGPLSDVYSLGAILYECLTGRPPFKGATVLDTLEQVRSVEPVAPSRLQPKVPRDLETICLKCLHKELAKRYPDAATLAEDLRRFRNHEPILARPVGRIERTWRWCRRNPAVAGLLAMVVLLLLAGSGISTYFAVEERAQRKDAQFQAGVAADKAVKEEKARKDEEIARQDADRNAKLERQQREKTERQHYLTLVHLAHQRWRDNQVASALDTLDTCPWHLCGWEWDYLRRLCQGSRLTLHGHTSFITSVAFSPDGKRLASSSGDHTVRVWDPSNGKDLHLLRGHSGPVTSVAFSPDGQRLVTASAARSTLKQENKAGEVKVWDLNTHQAILTLGGHTDTITSVAFSPNGQLLATGGTDKMVQVLEAATGRTIHKLAEKLDQINHLVFSPDGKRLAAALHIGTVVLWDTVTGKEVLTIRSPITTVSTAHVHGVAFSPNGKHLAGACATWDMKKQDYSRGEVKVWDSTTGEELLSFKGHTWRVNSVAFGPEGKYLVSAGLDRAIKLWDLNGQEIATLRGHSLEVARLALSSDGKRLASASQDKTVKVWDLDTSPEAATLAGHDRPVQSIAFSPDSRRLASSCGHVTWGEVKVWDSATREQLLHLKGHGSFIYSVAFDPDGKHLVTGGYDKTVNVWNLETQQVLFSLQGHTGPVTSVAFSPDGKFLASASEDKLVKVWDRTTRREVHTLRGHTGNVYSVAFRPDGKQLASGSHDATIKLWDVTTGQEVHTVKGHTLAVRCVAYSQDGKHLASASYDQTVRVWDAESGEPVVAIRDRTSRIESVAFNRDGARLAGGAIDGTVKLWDVHTGQEALTLHGHNGSIMCVAFSPDGRRLASASSDGQVKIWEAFAQPAARNLWGHNGLAFAAVFSPDGKRLVSAGADATQTEVKVWDATTGQEIRSVKRLRASSLKGMIFNQDCSLLIIGNQNQDRTATVWDLNTGQDVFALPAHQGAVTSAAISPDAKRLATASRGAGVVQVWDLATQQAVLTLQGHTGLVGLLAFSPDGKQLATASRDKSVKVWDLSNGQAIHTLEGHGSDIHSLAFSPDGQKLARGSLDGTITLWDLKSGQETLTLVGHASFVSSVAFHPDGKRLASASFDQLIRIWDLDTGQAVTTLCGHSRPISSVAFSPDGKRLVSTGGDEVKVWNLAEWEPQPGR